MLIKSENLSTKRLDHVHVAEQHRVQRRYVLLDVRARLVDLVQDHHLLLDALDDVVDVLAVRGEQVFFLLQNDVDERLVVLADLLQPLRGAVSVVSVVFEFLQFHLDVLDLVLGAGVVSRRLHGVVVENRKRLLLVGVVQLLVGAAADHALDALDVLVELFEFFVLLRDLHAVADAAIWPVLRRPAVVVVLHLRPRRHRPGSVLSRLRRLELVQRQTGHSVCDCTCRDGHALLPLERNRQVFDADRVCLERTEFI